MFYVTHVWIGQHTCVRRVCVYVWCVKCVYSDMVCVMYMVCLSYGHAGLCVLCICVLCVLSVACDVWPVCWVWPVVCVVWVRYKEACVWYVMCTWHRVCLCLLCVLCCVHYGAGCMWHGFVSEMPSGLQILPNPRGEVQIVKPPLSKRKDSGVPIVAQWKQIQLGTMRLGVWSLALLSGLRIWSCCELWYKPAAVALIRPLAWEPPHAVGAALKSRKNKQKPLY